RTSPGLIFLTGAQRPVRKPVITPPAFVNSSQVSAVNRSRYKSAMRSAAPVIKEVTHNRTTRGQSDGLVTPARSGCVDRSRREHAPVAQPAMRSQHPAPTWVRVYRLALRGLESRLENPTGRPGSSRISVIKPPSGRSEIASAIYRYQVRPHRREVPGPPS